MSELSAKKRWGMIVKTLETAGLGSLAAYVDDESKVAHAAPLSIPIIGETGSGKSALVARIFGVNTQATFPQDVLESTARPVEVKYAPAYYRAVVHGDHGDTDEWEECEDDTRWNALVRGQVPLSSGSRLEVGLRCEELETWNASIVDTPGMNTNTPKLEGRAWAAAATAPVVILAIPATSTGRSTDIDYLESLGKNSSSVIIALTKTDQLPLDSVDRVIENFRNRLAERGISPLDILPTSAVTGEDKQGGIAKLRQVLSEVTGNRRDQLVAHHVGGHVVAKIQSELSALLLKQSALESEALTKEAHSKGEERDIREGGKDEEIALRNATDRLKDRCDTLRFEAFNHIHEIGKEILQTISEKIDSLQTQNEIQHFADGSVRRYILQWREQCIAAAEKRLDALNQEGVQSAKEVTAQHFGQIKVSMDWLQELPEGTVTHHSDLDAENENVLRYVEDLSRQIKELQKDAPTAEQLEDIQRELSLTQEERDAIEYVPQIDVVHLDQGRREIQEVGRTIGMIADVALTLLPIPTGGKVGMFLKSLPKGRQIVSGIQKYNRLIGKRDKWLKGALGAARQLPVPGAKQLPGLRRIVENLSLETWGERLGDKIGGRIYPDKIVEKENEEVRQEFLKRRKPYDDAIYRLDLERERIRRRQEHIDRLLKIKIADQNEAMKRATRLKEEKRKLEADRQRLETEEQATEAKTALMAQLSVQFLAHEGDSLCADIRKAVAAGFDSAQASLEDHLRERVRAIKAEVQTALEDAQAKHVQGEKAVKEALETNQEMRAALQSALLQLETL